MAYQPHDIFTSTYDDNEYESLDATLTSFDYSQADNSVFDSLIGNGSSLPAIQSVALSNPNEFSNETSSVEDSLGCSMELFPEVQLEDLLSMDPFDGSINEVTVTTGLSDVEDDTIHDALAQLNLNGHENVVPDATETTVEIIDLESRDSSIPEQLLSFIGHPTKDRRRYGSEGKRRAKKLHSDLMVVDLSKLKNYKLAPGQVLWLRFTLVTDSDSPYIHSDKLVYYSDDAQSLADGSVRVRVTQSDIDKGKIELPDLSIVKSKLKTYTFKLIPYSQLTIHTESEIYITDTAKTAVGNAQAFRTQFNLKASRIACQILIEENELLHPTTIACMTNVMNEQKKYKSITTKSNKPVGKKNRKLKTKRLNPSKPKAIKRKNRSCY